MYEFRFTMVQHILLWKKRIMISIEIMNAILVLTLSNSIGSTFTDRRRIITDQDVPPNGTL